MRPILFALLSVNQRALSGPVLMYQVPLLAVGMLYCLSVPVVVMRPIWFAFDSANQSLPSGPAVMPIGTLLAMLRANCLNCLTWVLATPTWLARNSVNQRLWSEPTTIFVGWLVAPLGTAYWVRLPERVRRPMYPLCSANQKAPSAPTVMPTGLPLTGYVRRNWPEVLKDWICPASASVNQRLPSGPVMMAAGPLLDVGTAYSVI